jgi:hypothetical protein
MTVGGLRHGRNRVADARGVSTAGHDEAPRTMRVAPFSTFPVLSNLLRVSRARVDAPAALALQWQAVLPLSRAVPPSEDTNCHA